MTRTQKFIESNKRLLDAGRDFFNPDTSLMSLSEFDKADLRVLVVFPSPSDVKAVSTTKEALNDYVISICNQPRTAEQNSVPFIKGYEHRINPESNHSRGPLNVFIDFAYYPSASDLKLYDKSNVPYAIGNITHLDASHFDVVGFSISVLAEVVAAPSIISTFNRCDKSIPLSWTERKSLPVGSCPIMFAGGITAVCGDIMYGQIDSNRQAFLDFSYLGECGKLDIIFERLIAAKQSSISNQEFIDSLFDLHMVYQPQAYKVVMNDKNQIISNKKINPKAQDFVKPYYPLEFEDTLGIARSIINADGDGVGTSQSQVSEGAMLKGTLIRTSQGFKRVEELAPNFIGDTLLFNGPFVDTTSQAGVISHSFYHGVRKLRLFTLKSGIQIGLTDEHPVEQWKIGSETTYFKSASNLQVGDFFLLKKGSLVCGQSEMTESEAEFLGRMLGDGSYNLYDDSRGNRKPYHKMYLSCDWEEVEYCEDLLSRANLNFTKDTEQGRHCRFWIMSEDKMGRRMDDYWGFNQRYGEWENHTQGKKYIPSPVYQFNNLQMKAFLKGFHDADGCSSTKNGLSKVTFDSCHEHIINDVQQFLLFVGIPSTKHYYKKHRVADDNLGFKETDNDHYCLTISSEYFQEFNNLGVLKKAYCRSTRSKEKLPFHQETIRDIIYKCDISTSQRSKAFDAVRRNSFTKELAKKLNIPYPDLLFDEIVSIEEVEGEVYDLTVPAIEKLIANGCSIHNCSAAGSCSFCAEGNYTGGWVEKSRERILWEIRESKKYSAGYKYKPYSFNSLSVNSFIPIGDGKFKRGFHLKKDDHILNLKGKSNFGGIHFGEKEILDIRLNQGAGLRITPEHRQTKLTSEGLVDVLGETLKPGDWIPQITGYYKHLAKSADIYSDEYLKGVWYGDGYFAGGSSYLAVNKNEVKLLAHLRNFIVSEKEDNDGVIRCLLNHQFTVKLKKFSKEYKSVSNETADYNIQQWISFIRGWFDADGCASGGFIKLTAKEERVQMLRDVSVVLASLGIRTRLSKPITVRIEDKTYVRRDLYVVGLESRIGFSELIGVTESKFINVKLVSTKWSDKDKCIPGEFGRWVFSDLKKIGKEKGHNASKFFRGIKGMTVERFLELFGDFDLESVNLIKGGVRFSKVEEIVRCNKEEVVDVLETSDGRWIANGYLTHNCNYLTDYKGFLYEARKIFPKVTFINMRMEELGRDTDALKMMKLIGSNRISAPMEGISPRIQNNLLNKCLSEESLNNFMDDMVHARLTDIKVGGIFTGYEEDEDFQWICDFVDRFKKRASDEGGNFPMRLKVTPLVHYQLTPCEYLERKSARKSMLGEHWLTDEWYAKFKEHNVFFKVNGFKYSTFLEQCIIDLGRFATQWMYDNIILAQIPVYSLRSFAKEEIVDNLKKMINTDHFFEVRDPEHYISLSHRIHIDLMGSYIPRARRLVRHYKKGNIFDNPEDIRCLKTFEGAKTKCYSSCIKDDPLKIYSDVEMDEEGNLHGDYRELVGCERCPSATYKKQRLNRSIIQTKNSDDIIAMPSIKAQAKVRFVISRNRDYDLLNPNNTAHTFVAKLLQKSERLVDLYHSIECHSNFWQADPDLVYSFSGLQVVDVLFQSSEAISIVESLVPEVNKELKSLKIVQCKQEFLDDKLKITDYNVFRFESTLPLELFNTSTLSYKGDIRVKKNELLENITDSELKPPVFITKGKVVGYFILPLRYNPTYYIQGFLKDKKLSINKIVETTTFENMMVVRGGSTTCKICGKEKGVISMITGSQLPFGLNCLPKVLLKRELSK